MKLANLLNLIILLNFAQVFADCSLKSGKEQFNCSSSDMNCWNKSNKCDQEFLQNSINRTNLGSRRKKVLSSIVNCPLSNASSATATKNKCVQKAAATYVATK